MRSVVKFCNLTKVRPLLTHTGSDNSPYWSCSVIFILTNQIVTFIYLSISLSGLHARGDTALHLKHVIWFGRNHDEVIQIQSSYRVYLNAINNGVLSDPLCDRVNKSLTLVRLEILKFPWRPSRTYSYSSS